MIVYVDTSCIFYGEKRLFFADRFPIVEVFYVKNRTRFSRFASFNSYTYQKQGRFYVFQV